MSSLEQGAVNRAPVFTRGPAGKQVTDLGGQEMIWQALVAADGALVVAASAGTAAEPGDFAAVRYLPDGTPDPAFGQGGAAIAGFGGYEWVRSAAVQPDGRVLVVGGRYVGAGSAVALMRFNTDGTLDTTFGDGGRVSSILANGYQEVAMRVLLQPDGRILASVKGGDAYALVRYTADGALDTSFAGGTGVAKWDLGTHGGTLELQPDGKILVGGGSMFGGSTGLYARYLADGSLDPAFGSGGKVWLEGISGALATRFLADGRIELATSFWPPGGPAVRIFRLNADGSRDPAHPDTFGPSGTLEPSAAAFQADGKLLVGGSHLGAANRDFVVRRYDTDGSLDASFGIDGELRTDFAGQDDWLTSLAVLDDGSIVATGGTNSNLAVARYHADGARDAGFGSLSAPAVFTEGRGPVALDDSLRIADADLAEAGSFDGASLTLSRRGGASPDDAFTAVATLAPLVEGGALRVSGVEIGTVQRNGAGELAWTFGPAATPARVNEALNGIAYANLARFPTGTITIDWTFSDGNTGAQGTGGAQWASHATELLLVGVNTEPWPDSDDDGPFAEDASIALSAAALLANDVDKDGDPLHIASVTAPRGGTVELRDGAVVFTPPPDFNGYTAFEYTAADPYGGSSSTSVWLQVTPAPDAVADSAQVAAGAEVTIDVLANDSFSDPNALVSWVRQPAHGQAVIVDAAAGLLRYTPETGYTGEDSFSYEVEAGNDDETATVLVSVLAAPVSGVAWHWKSHALLALEGGSPPAGSLAGAVTSADALAALRLAVGRNPNPDPDGAGPLAARGVAPWQIVAADVNGDGWVTSGDALAILRMAAHSPGAPAPGWVLLAETLDVWDEVAQASLLTRSHAAWNQEENARLLQDTGMGRVGIVRGDVDGSWTAPEGTARVEDTRPAYFEELSARLAVPLELWGL